ncbi:MAG: sigma-70 family RNA polymerase sigma factor [Deltaproteobacteria bacterium]|nr:sigma-70 family RNA polymerase sigma factor [Deltaproteobacteria bacterium]
MGHDSADRGLSRYIERVRAIPLLDRDEEHETAVRAAAGDERARDHLVRSNLRFVVAMAVQHQRKGVRLADLVAEGNVGLVIASKKFDPTRGTRFVTYAGFWIRAYILDLIVRASAVVGAGSGPMRSKIFFRLRRERARLAQAGIDGAERTRILAEKLGTTEARIEHMISHLDLRAVSVDAPIGSETATTLLDTMEGEVPDPEHRLVDEEASSIAHRRLHDALAKLDPRERFIVEQRFMQDEEPSLADLGRTLGVSRERARQLEVRAHGKLREQLADLAEARAA